MLPARASATLGPLAAGAGLGIAGVPGGGTIEDGGKRASQLKRLLTDKVKAEPEVASRLVQSWVHGEEPR